MVAKKVILFFFSLYGFLVFLVIMFLLLPFFVIAFLRSEVKGGNMVIGLANVWADIFFFAIRIKYRTVYEEKHDPGKEYIFISNHISYLDIPMILKAARGQYFRILGKASMADIPIFGSIYRRGAVTVDREDDNDKMESVQKLIGLINQKISVFICPEGTFNITHHPLKFFYDGAFRIAIETQKPIKPVLFLDTYDRLNYNSIFSLNPGICRAVFLSETRTAGMKMEQIKELKESIFKQMEDALVRYKAGWIEECKS